MSEFYDKDPAAYVRPLWDAALSYWDTQRDRVQEQWDMTMGRDAFMTARRKAGYSALSVPLIYIVQEARKATMLEIMNQQENMIRFEPHRIGDFLSEITAERLESAFARIRSDLEWDEKIMDLFDACEMFDTPWVAMEVESLMVAPHHGVIVPREMYGTEKVYPSWNVYSPGQIICDGFYTHEREIPAKFKTTFMSYHQLKREYPDRIGEWVRQYAKPRDDSAFYNPADPRESDEEQGTAAVMWDRKGGGGERKEKGFLVAEGHIEAVYSDGMCRSMIYTFLPEVVNGPKSSEASQHGYKLRETPKPYQSVQNMMWPARGRTLPFTLAGKGTTDMLIPFQREFSHQISTERDLDDQYLAPPMAVRTELLIGKEQPSLQSSEIWSFRDKDWSRNLPLHALAAPIVTPTPNRGYMQSTRSTMENLVYLIGAAMEAQTGDEQPGGRTATEFSGRSKGAAKRINLVFSQHARTLRRVVQSVLAMMGETPREFLDPPIRAESQMLGSGGMLTEQDVIAGNNVYIPALSEYANREFAKVTTRMIADGMAQLPVVGQSMETQVLLVEDLARSQGFPEQRIQEYKQTLKTSIMQAQMMQALTSLAPSIDDGTGPPGGPASGPPGGGMGADQVANVGNMLPMAAA